MAIGLLPGDRGGDTEPKPIGATPPRTTPRPPDADPWDRWREAAPVVWETWWTSGDERVCPICGPLAGIEFRGGEGPAPPLHANCRCRREVSRVEWILRDT